MPYRYLLLFGLILPVAATRSKEPQVPKSQLDTTQQAVHVLNRLGYGPRPNDVANIIKTGVVDFIELQLHPDDIDDSALKARLASLETIRLSTRELAELFPNPGLVRRFGDRGLIDESEIPSRVRPTLCLSVGSTRHKSSLPRCRRLSSLVPFTPGVNYSK